MNEAISHSGVRRFGAGDEIALALGHRVTVRVSNFRGARRDPVVITLANGLTVQTMKAPVQQPSAIVQGQQATTGSDQWLSQQVKKLSL